MIYIGIDTGVHTGFAVWDSSKRELVELDTMTIHEAIFKTSLWKEATNGDMMVLFEDARQRTWFGKGNTNAKMQGAGSVKRDAKIWEDFLTDYGIPFRAIPPIKGATKLTPSYFKMITGYKGRTSEHARDAAMLVFGR